MSTLLEQQNKVIIALLARSTIGIEYIEKVVRSGKKKGKSDDFVRAYNELDGSRSVTEIAGMIGVSKQNVSQVLQTWEEKGIVYSLGTGNRTVYVGLLKLPIKSKSRSAPKKTKRPRKPKTSAPSIQRNGSDIAETSDALSNDDSPER